uniref:Uncharacterized protein n=1 Tax=Meloidogyne floridensis TaxID=298350 RepID=A0A915NPP4_9BILA
MKIKVMNNQVEIEPKTKDASTQTTTRTKSVSSQTEPRMKNASIQTTIETNSAEIQTQPQIKEVCVQTNKIKTVDAQTNTFVSNYSLPASPTFGGRPRKPVENLSTRRIEQLAKELADFHRERTPDSEGNPSTYTLFRMARHSLNVFTPEKPKQKKLTILQDLFAMLTANISFNSREILKRNLMKAGFDIFVSQREFFTTKNKITAGLEIKWKDSFLTCVNVKNVIEKRIEQLLLKGMFIGDPTLVLMGDKGASTTKIGILPIIKCRTCSPSNLSIVSIWEGDDNRQALRNVKELFEELSKIENVKWILTGDLKFLSALIGHRGAASNNPCCICRTPKEHLEINGEKRNYSTQELLYSFEDVSLFPIGPGQILPPPLHITHGVATRAINILEILIDKNILCDFLHNRHIRRDPRTKTFRGNDLSSCRTTMLQRAAALWHKLMEGVSWFFTQSGSQLFSDPMNAADLVEKGAELLFKMFQVLRNHLQNIATNGNINVIVREKAASAAKKARPFPKLHYLRHHCAEFIRKNGWWGIASEQAIESYHAVFNKLLQELRFRNVRDRKLQIERMMRHHFLLNYLHDRGFND